MGDQTAAADDDAPDRFACLRVFGERWLGHLLLQFKPAWFLFRILGDCFVHVSSHGICVCYGFVLMGDLTACGLVSSNSFFIEKRFQ